MTIAAGLSGLKAAADLTRILRDGLKSGQITVDQLSGRIGEIYDYIINSRDALVDAKDEIQSLKAQIDAFNERKQIDSELEHDGYVFWRKVEGKKTGPFCPACWRADNRLMPLTHIPGNFGTDPSSRYDCVLHATYLVPNGSPQQSPSWLDGPS
jgi:hypothetical protein